MIRVPIAGGLSTRDWVMIVLGGVFFALVLAGLVALSAWLVREMQLNQRQRAFLDAVTHEMRTPLASLRLYLETLDRHDPDAEQRREFLGRMREDVDRLGHTVEQVLLAARTEEQRRGLPSERVTLSELLDECIEELCTRHDLPENAVHLDVRSPTTVRGNRAELSVVFRNLLENAVKYSDDPVEIHVRVRPEGRRTASTWRSPIAASASPPGSCARSSSASTARDETCSARRPASGWVCSSSATWCGARADGSSPAARDPAPAAASW